MAWQAKQNNYSILEFILQTNTLNYILMENDLQIML